MSLPVIDDREILKARSIPQRIRLTLAALGGLEIARIRQGRVYERGVILRQARAMGIETGENDVRRAT